MNSIDFLFTFYSKESRDGANDYAANILRDNKLTINGKPCLFWFGDMDNDVDGSPYWNDDKSGQAGTRWQYNHKPINGDIIPFIVVPPQIIKVTPEIIGGCIGTVEYNNIVQSVVVGDSGPSNKIGEGSPATLRALGLTALKNGNGGIDDQKILYRIWPGVAARLMLGDGSIYQFELQHA
jgi:hypothetical protein